MMPKKTNYPTLSKNTKRIWVFLLVFVIALIVVVQKFEDYQFNKRFEEATSTPDPIDQLSGNDWEYANWFKTNSMDMAMKEDYAMMAAGCMPKADCRKNLDGYLQEMSVLSAEIVHAPEPDDPQLQAIQEEYSKMLPLIGELMGIETSYDTGWAENVLNEEYFDSIYEHIHHIDNARAMMDEYLENLGD
jgi:hypothetical protein